MPAEIAGRGMVFRDRPLPRSLSMARAHALVFTAWPRTAWDLALNKLIHSAVHAGAIAGQVADDLVGLSVAALLLPRPLAHWLERWDWPQVERAVACLLMDGQSIGDPEAEEEEEGDEIQEDFGPPIWPAPPGFWEENSAEKGKPSSQTASEPEAENSDLDPPTPPLEFLIRGLPLAARNHPCPSLPFSSTASRELDDLLKVVPDAPPATEAEWAIPIILVTAYAPGTYDPCTLRSHQTFLRSIIEFDRGLAFDIPDEPILPKITAAEVLNLQSPWHKYSQIACKVPVSLPTALIAFGKIVDRNRFSALWQRVAVVREIVQSGRTESTVPSGTEKVLRKHRRRADRNGCAKRRRVGMQNLPLEVLEEVLVPRMFMALSEET